MEDDDSSSLQTNPLDVGKSLHGCIHYRRRCKIRAPCCNQIFTCRHCHNEYTNALANPKERHEIVRHDIKQVICAICNTEQQVAQICTNCGVKMGEYFCGICKFYDDDISKEQFHCNDCGICRVGGSTNFFHCEKCGSCFDVILRGNHTCVGNSMKNHCPICYEIEATVMPEEYRYEIHILCNDCHNTSKAFFHIFGHKCGHCKSYNTRRIGTTDDSLERRT